MFDLSITGERRFEDGAEVFPAEIRLGSFSEGFEVPAGFWTAADYESHWLAGAQRLVEGASRVGLLVEAPNPAADRFFWWTLWRDGPIVYAQNGILFRSKLVGSVDLTNPDRFVEARRETSDDGGRISQWQLALDDIVSYVSRMRPRLTNCWSGRDR
jgi:hypothetical protein